MKNDHLRDPVSSSVTVAERFQERNALPDLSLNRVVRRTALLFVIPVILLNGLRADAQDVDFDRDIEPILQERCRHCHGEDEQESGLRLDVRSGMISGGDSGLAAVVPGRPDRSYLIEVVRHLDPGVEMPPDEDPLSSEQIALLERWIQQGAVWPGQMEETAESDEADLWSFRPVVRPEIPAAATEAAGAADVTAEEARGTSNPIDAFLLRRLQDEGLGFSEPADPEHLLRRVSVVLTGLPPTPEALREFSAAFRQDPDRAYEEAVEQLLHSPHFGERWAQHWLDVIRWAETNGSEANLYRKNAWMYRDYVIRSFNEDKPYDRFVREQIAGDTLGVGEATGFLVAGPHVPAATVGREPAAIRQARADRMDEIMQTVGASVMGVTIGCARCHNHKFDPISIRDYYAMTAVFQDIEFGGRHPEYSPDHPLRQRGAELWAEIAEQRQKLRPDGGWEENWGAYRELHFRPVTTSAVRIRFKMPNIFLDELEVLGPENLNRNLALADFGTKVTGHPELGFETRNPVDRVNDGQYGTMVWRAKTEKGEERPWVRFDFADAVRINRLRLSNNREYFYDTDYLTRKPGLPRYEFDMDILTEDGEWQPWVGTWFVNKKLPEEHPGRRQTLNEIGRLIGLLAEEGPRPGFVGRLIEPQVTHVLLRGSPESPRDEVAPAGPRMLEGDLGLTSEDSGPKRRRAFADWIADKRNPLTTRVMVNRIWHHVFGNGLVSTTSDFGRAGALPTHPELLDWLAAEFTEPTVGVSTATGGAVQETASESGAAGRSPRPWSVRHMIRLMVLSDAFRQSSRPHEQGTAIDAGSQLLWRFPPRRVEAEVIRDAVLQAAGNLDLTVGGRSYRIHNEKATYAQWEVTDNHGPHTWRRMIYQERMRRVDDRLFTAFDFPDCGQVRARRPVSTTPLQALNLLNSEFVTEQADYIAARASEDADGDAARSVDRCFELLLGRLPDVDERSVCIETARAGELMLVCRALINSNEFVFLP